MPNTVIIRDFAYPETDKRFHGIYSTTGNGQNDDDDVPEMDTEHDDDDQEFEDMEDEKLWEWFWTYAQNGENAGGSLQRLEARKISGSILPTFDSLIQKGLSSTDLPPFSFTRVKTIFPFVKGTDYEMSLESGDELLIIDFNQQDMMPDTPMQERWSSIDGMPEEGEGEPALLSLTVDPPVDPFCGDIKQFLGFNKKYGDGWVTALKIRVYGNWTTKAAKIVLRDIGLVPGNYIEPIL